MNGRGRPASLSERFPLVPKMSPQVRLDDRLCVSQHLPVADQRDIPAFAHEGDVIAFPDGSRRVVPPRPVLATAEPLTELGAAERFARLHGDDVRFDHRRGRFLLWRDHHWDADADGAINRMTARFAREWQAEAVTIPDHAHKTETLRFVLRLERRDGQANLLALAKSQYPIAVSGEAFDADPWLLGVPNGVVDLRTGELRDGRPADCITMQTRTTYDPDARCPRWERFVASLFANDPDLAAFVQRAIGYSLTGITTEQALFLLYGTGSNGKGTLTNTLKRILGAYAWNMPFATVEFRDRAGIPNDIAALDKRRFVIASETNDGQRLNEARVKALTGCDPITARFLHGEFFTFEPVAKLWLSLNHKPIVRDDSYGFWRRIRLIPFTQVFGNNPTLADELMAEASGVLAWAVRGCLEWQRIGLQPPAIIVSATAEYETDSDPLAAFLAEACEEAEGSEIRASELYAHYTAWADRNGLSQRERLKSTSFGRKLSARFRKQHTATGKVYLGIARRAL